MPTRDRSRPPTGRGPLLAAALVPALALLAAACGGTGGSADGHRGRHTPGPVVASGAIPVARLTRALLTSADVPHVTVLPAGNRSQLLGGPQKADKSTCQPLADQWSTGPKHPRQVYAGAILTDTATGVRSSKAITLEVIASYRRGEARAVLDDLTAALGSCPSYTAVRGGKPTTFRIHPVPGGPRLGDQQVTYTVTDTARGAAGTVLVTVVRTGDATAAYETVRQDHRPATLRAAVPLRQAAKLTEAINGT